MIAIKIPNSDGFLWNGPSITGFFSTLRGKVLVVWLSMGFLLCFDVAKRNLLFIRE
jgi:hypothetical protein